MKNSLGLCDSWVPGHTLACSRSQRGFACDTWLTEGAGDRLVREDGLAPAPGPAPAATAQPPQTACGEPARAGQWQAPRAIQNIHINTS